MAGLSEEEKANEQAIADEKAEAKRLEDEEKAKAEEARFAALTPEEQ